MIVLFDVETTGADDGAEIIEAAIGGVTAAATGPLVPDLGNITVERFKPSVPIELGAMATHHIVDDDLVTCRPSSAFSLPPETTLLIGHNIDFDWRMAGSPPIHRICTLALARAVWPTLGAHTQSALVYHILPPLVARGRLRGAHTAEADVLNLFVVLSTLCQILQPESWKHLYRMSEEARVPKVMAFGKHKGTAIDELPRGYRDWILGQSDMDEYLQIAVRRSFGIRERDGVAA